MVETDRADAYVTDHVLLRSLLAKTKCPADIIITSDSISIEPYGIAMAKDGSAFKQLVDDVLTGIYRSDKGRA